MDGNGRVGRALFALMIYSMLGHSKPWLYLSPYFERHKEEYYDNLFRVSTHGDWERWIDFCIHGIIVQAKDSIRRCEQLHRIRTEYHARVSEPSRRTHAIIEMLFVNPLLTVTEIRDRLAIEYHTARKDLERLVAAKILVELPDVHPRSFFAQEIMQVAFSDND
jgi:Fic family protein